MAINIYTYIHASVKQARTDLDELGEVVLGPVPEPLGEEARLLLGHLGREELPLLGVRGQLVGVLFLGFLWLGGMIVEWLSQDGVYGSIFLSGTASRAIGSDMIRHI